MVMPSNLSALETMLPSPRVIILMASCRRADVRGAAHHDAGRPDSRAELPPLLQADRARSVGHRRRLPGRAARRPLRHAVPLPSHAVGVPHRRHVKWLLQGDRRARRDGQLMPLCS